MQPPIYDPEACRPMWEELEQVGFESLSTPEAVEEAVVQTKGTVLLFINSVCGCSAGAARPGLSLSLQHSHIPGKLVTVFAGVHRDAVDKARELMPQVPPSSPFTAIFKDGELVYVLQRSQIEMMDAVGIAQTLRQVYDEFCEAEGPSVPREVFEAIPTIQQCGSSIPRFNDM
jgi:putative YphP/YqiW family bacilliredoxin